MIKYFIIKNLKLFKPNLKTQKFKKPNLKILNKKLLI